jgi:hypothetical protein
MTSCRHASRLISDGVDRPLSWGERLRSSLHLLVCPPCRRFRRAVRWLHRTLAPGETRLPSDARERIGRALEQSPGYE